MGFADHALCQGACGHARGGKGEPHTWESLLLPQGSEKCSSFPAALWPLLPRLGVAWEATRTTIMQLDPPSPASCESKGEGRVAGMLLRAPSEHACSTLCSTTGLPGASFCSLGVEVVAW